MIGTETTE